MSKTKAQLEAQVKHDAHLIEGLQAEIRKRDEKLEALESQAALVEAIQQSSKQVNELNWVIRDMQSDINSKLELTNVVRVLADRL